MDALSRGVWMDALSSGGWKDTLSKVRVVGLMH